MVGPVSFQGLQTVQNSQTRYVDAGNGQFRAANEGSWKDKAVNWLKETFRPGLVKQENAQAYAAAKQAFIASGGDGTRAAAFFNGRIATGVRFTPADIKPTLSYVADRGFDQNDKAYVVSDVKMRGTSGAKMTANPVDSSQQLDSVFITDCGRAKFKIDGEAVDKSSQTAALTSFAEVAQRKGISAQDMSGISKFAHQQTMHFFCNYVQDPAHGKFTSPSGEPLMPVFSMGAADGAGEHSLDIVSRGQGQYSLEFSMNGPISASINGNTGATNTNVDQARSRFVANFSILIGPDAQTGQMTLLDMETARYGAHMYDPQGSKIL